MEKAQQALQASGFNVGALRAEPRAAAESYARLKAEITAAEVRTQVLRGSLADSAPEVQRQLAQLSALRAQLARLEQATDTNVGPDYLTKYREFKYRETLFELFARQYEIARVDESREGALIQIVDPAVPPEYKSKPKRAVHRGGGHAVEPAAAGHVHPGAPFLARDRGRPGRRREGGAAARRLRTTLER